MEQKFTEEEYRFIMEIAKYWHFEKLDATEIEREYAYSIYAKAREALENLKND